MSNPQQNKDSKGLLKMLLNFFKRNTSNSELLEQRLLAKKQVTEAADKLLISAIHGTATRISRDGANTKHDT